MTKFRPTRRTSVQWRRSASNRVPAKITRYVKALSVRGLTCIARRLCLGRLMYQFQVQSAHGRCRCSDVRHMAPGAASEPSITARQRLSASVCPEETLETVSSVQTQEPVTLRELMSLPAGGPSGSV